MFLLVLERKSEERESEGGREEHHLVASHRSPERGLNLKPVTGNRTCNPFIQGDASTSRATHQASSPSQNQIAIINN